MLERLYSSNALLPATVCVEWSCSSIPGPVPRTLSEELKLGVRPKKVPHRHSFQDKGCLPCCVGDLACHGQWILLLSPTCPSGG
jgi:hypothetical protein